MCIIIHLACIVIVTICVAVREAAWLCSGFHVSLHMTFLWLEVIIKGWDVIMILT